MPSSQLKRLKASLRDQGIVGPQQSKKQKKKNAQDALAKKDKRLRRSAALDSIREQFNPFQFKMNARGPKFQVTTSKPMSETAARGIKGRPGVTLSLSEERVSFLVFPWTQACKLTIRTQRRKTLLVDMQRRNKVGGILDRRFGEDDPTLTPEAKALQRFAIEKQRNHKKSSLFDLEEDESGISLTHMGKSLSLDDDKAPRDDFDEKDLLVGSDDDDFSQVDRKRLKRMRGEAFADEEDEAGDEPPRRKSNQEVWKEVIAKSKLYKYERQAAKEDDDTIRAEIDKELSGIRPLLFARKDQLDEAQPHDQGGTSETGCWHRQGRSRESLRHPSEGNDTRQASPAQREGQRQNRR